MNAGLLAATIVVGTLVLVGGILIAVFSAVRKAAGREAAELASEGIVLDSGPSTMKASFQELPRAERVHRRRVAEGPARIVLTKRRFTFVPSGQNRFGFARMDHAELARFEVGVSDGKLHLHSDRPPNASGTVDLFLSVADPASWVRALTDAGARPMSPAERLNHRSAVLHALCAEAHLPGLQRVAAPDRHPRPSRPHRRESTARLSRR